MNSATDATQAATPDLFEITIGGLLSAYRAGTLSAREAVRYYLERIAAFDQQGPALNSIISLNPEALAEAARLDETLRVSGPIGPLHGVPVILKDQIDAVGMPTTLGSVLFRDFRPEHDAFVVQRLKQAGAIILAKATLGELGQGDTHGSLFGSTRNPYDLERTAGGSSGGPAAAISANLGAVAVGQEALASIRRPAAWNSIVGMRPTSGLVSRSGVFAGWPGRFASLGPLTRSVEDAAVLMDVLTGYDPEDPITALGAGQTPRSFTASLDQDGLKGARIGVLRKSIGANSEPQSADFAKVDAVFAAAVKELNAAGALIVDNLVIPGMRDLLARRGGSGDPEEAWDVYFRRNSTRPYATQADMQSSPDYSKVVRRVPLAGNRTPPTREEYYEAREELMVRFLKAMADHDLDAIIHKSVEHQATLIRDAFQPPYVNIKGATSLNTFLIYVPAISVPAGFTTDGMPVGITFTGRPFSDGLMLKLAYGYEQATRHRIPPASTPALPG
jgi:Asp-tRNA(Asn)/Glu-tRNA(Gln) amidotransferase A subunit family amidase